MHSDPIADMLTRIRNGMAARHHKVEIPGSKVKIELARILKEEGYVANYRVATDNNKKTLKVYLKYRPDNRPVITRLTRVSKPGRRVYVDAQRIPRVIGGMGVSVRHRDRMISPEALGDEALDRARQRLGTRKGPTLTTTMVVDRTVASGLIWRLLSPASGSAVQQKRSMWANQIGERKVSPQLTITNDPTLPGALGSQPFDSEGLPAFTMPIIEGGVLRNYFLDTYSARKLELRPTTGDWANIVVAPAKAVT